MVQPNKSRSTPSSKCFIRKLCKRWKVKGSRKMFSSIFPWMYSTILPSSIMATINTAIAGYHWVLCRYAKNSYITLYKQSNNKLVYHLWWNYHTSQGQHLIVNILVLYEDKFKSKTSYWHGLSNILTLTRS